MEIASEGLAFCLVRPHGFLPAHARCLRPSAPDARAVRRGSQRPARCPKLALSSGPRLRRRNMGLRGAHARDLPAHPRHLSRPPPASFAFSNAGAHRLLVFVISHASEEAVCGQVDTSTPRASRQIGRCSPASTFASDSRCIRSFRAVRVECLPGDSQARAQQAVSGRRGQACSRRAPAPPPTHPRRTLTVPSQYPRLTLTYAHPHYRLSPLRARRSRTSQSRKSQVVKSPTRLRSLAT